MQQGTAATYWQLVRMSDPTNTKNTPADSTTFCLSCHNGAPPTTAANGQSVLVPYNVQLSNRPEPFFPGWNKKTAGLSFTASGHYTTTGTKALCENCHDPHGSVNARLLAWTKPASFAAGIAGSRDNTTSNATESNLCFQCHGNSGIAIGGFTGRTATTANGVNMDVATPMSKASRHSTTLTGLHADVEGPTDLGPGKRHSECVDCHNPHSARAGNHVLGSSGAGSVLLGTTGVQPTWPTNSNFVTASSYAPVTIDNGSTKYEAYLCFKCHTSYTGFATGHTDIAKEFNPGNQSGHNVMGATSSWPKSTVAQGLPYAFPTFPTSGVFVTTTISNMSVNYKVTCSDCHSSNAVSGAKGPHGSGALYIVNQSGASHWYQYNLGQMSSTVCGRCHDASSNSAHTAGNHSNYPCDYCHVRIPHGWKRPRLLVSTYFDTDPIYANTSGQATKGFPKTGINWGNETCETGCSHGSHNGVVTSANAWP